MLFRRLFLAFVVLASIMNGSALAAPKADLWERWAAQDPESDIVPDHAVWDAFLSRYVRTGADGIARVIYGAVTEADRAALRSYVSTLVATPVSRLSRREQLPFWVNLYNALTVGLILEHYPVASIRDIDISPGFFADGPWGKTLVAIEGEDISLDDIEHRILRPVWRDPRIHYAVNCASLGCPDLQAKAMTSANAKLFLEDGATAYINHPRGARIEGGKLIVSSIYDWFEEDFGDSDAGVIAHLKRYAKDDLAMALESVTRISDDAYDWRLNDVSE